MRCSLTAAGKPEVLELQEVPQPIATNKEILVKMPMPQKEVNYLPALII